MASQKQESVDQLNSFLRGEFSAVETYRQAREKLEDSSALMQLQECEQSHRDRAQRLSRRIEELGGEPAHSSGIWGTFATLVQGGANVFGEKSAIAALEEGEDHGLNDYRRDLSSLDADSRRLIEQEILPAQQRTHNMMSSVKKNLA